MTVESYLKILESRGIRPRHIPNFSDFELLKVRGIGKTGLAKLREKFGCAERPETLPLATQIATAISPVLRRRGVSEKNIRALARMVAAYVA